MMSDHPPQQRSTDEPLNNDPIWKDWRVTAYALGELEEPEHGNFEGLMAADPRLQEAVAEAVRVTGAVAASLRAEPVLGLSDVRRAKVLSYVSEEKAMNAPEPKQFRRRGGRAMLRRALAACLLFAAGGVAGYLSRPQGPELPPEAIQLIASDWVASPGVSDFAADDRQAGEDAESAFADLPLSYGPAATPADPSVPPTAAGPPADVIGGYGGGYRAIPLETRGEAQRGVSTRFATEGARPIEEHLFERKADDRLEGFRIVAVPHDAFYSKDLGRGPGQAGDQFEPITDNPFLRVSDQPLSTFSIDVDTASYSKVRQYLLEQRSMPRPDAVRIEELVNYFDYEYAPPTENAEHPFAASIAVASCPWNPEHRLARIGIQGRVVENDRRPPSNLVFLLDVSGSMDQPNKLPLVQRGMQMLLEQLGENDRVAIVVYAGAAGMVLDSTPADQRHKIFDAIERLKAGGSTNGGQGIQLAYETARDQFIRGGTNRVILCTDGDFNVGTTGTDQLVRMVEDQAKGGVFLTVLGFGMGNHNDAMLEKISGRGNGNYAFIDTASEARKVLVEQTSGTLVTIAKDVKIQVEFNPKEVAGYRLIGYENRILAKEDFNDDTKDAGEIGAGHSVTALYEWVPAGEPVGAAAPDVDPLRYQSVASETEAAASGEVLTLKMRYKQPEGERSTLVQFPVEDSGQSFAEADQDFRFAAAVAGFGMQLRNSPYKGNWSYAAIEETAKQAQGTDRFGFRSEFLRMVQQAAALAGEPREIRYR